MMSKNNSSDTDASQASSINSATTFAYDAYNGYQTTSEYLRSILIHRIGVPLTSYLNDIDLYTIGNDFIHSYNYNEMKINEKYYMNIFSNSINQWNYNVDTNLTDFLYNNIIDTNSSYLGVQKFIKSKKEKENGCVDTIMFTKDQSIVTIITVGLQNTLWWANHYQNINLARVVPATDDDKINALVDKPMLLVTVTVSRNQRNFVSRMGVFLLTKSNRHAAGTNTYRLALLWRGQLNSVTDATISFGKILYATELCAKWIDECCCCCQQQQLEYQYLGPNCCRIHDKVYRCYDTRIRPTSRKPDFYLQGPPKADKVIEIFDSTCAGTSVYDFGQELSKDNSTISNDTIVDWIWQFHGKLLLISTLYYNGVHYAQRPIHFIPIINQLEKLHQNGYVHGDIRSFNMVLCYGTTMNNTLQQSNKSCSTSNIVTNVTPNYCPLDTDSSCDEGISIYNSNTDSSIVDGYLIDFDMSGKQGTNLRYPVGYQWILEDGQRLGREDEIITFFHDWWALYYIIFELYHMMPSTNTNTNLCIDMYKEENEVTYLLRGIGMDNFSINDVPTVANNLRKILIEAETCSYTLTPTINFKRVLQNL